MASPKVSHESRADSFNKPGNYGKKLKPPRTHGSGSVQCNGNTHTRADLRFGPMLIQTPECYKVIVALQGTKEADSEAASFLKLLQDFCDTEQKWSYVSHTSETGVHTYLTKSSGYVVFIDMSDANKVQKAHDSLFRLRQRKDGDTLAIFGICKSTLIEPEFCLSLLGSGLNRILFLDQLESFLQVQLLMKSIEQSELLLNLKLRACKGALNALDAHCSNPIEITDSNKKIQFINKAFEKHTGCNRKALLGKISSDTQKTTVPSQPSYVSRRSRSANISELQSWHLHSFAQPGEDPKISQVIHVRDRPLIDDSYPPGSGGLTPDQVKLLKTIGPPIQRVLDLLHFVQTECHDNDMLMPVLNEVVIILTSKNLYNSITVLPEKESQTSKDIFSFYTQTMNRKESTAALKVSTFQDFLRRTLRKNFKQTRPSFSGDPELVAELSKVTRWDFDVVRVERITGPSRILSTVGMEIFRQYEVGNILKLPPETAEEILSNWLNLIEETYRANPYHTSTHAADVMQAMSYYVQLPEISKVLNGLEAAAALIAAVMHDVDHPGRSSRFLINTTDDLALLYNDTTVLENHHASYGWRLSVQHPECNIFAYLNGSDLLEMRKQILNMIVATDMGKHFQLVQLFRQVLPALQHGVGIRGKSGQDIDPIDMLLRILIKAADISNPTRPWHLCKEWAERIIKEYTEQSEEEMQRSLPLTLPNFTKDKCDKPDTQLVFIKMFASELFDLLLQLSPTMEIENGPIKHLKHNLSRWETEKSRRLERECSIDHASK